MILAALMATAALQVADWPGRPADLGREWDHIRLDGWTYAGRNADTMTLVQPGRQRGQVWVRYEYRTADSGYRSSRALMELNCGEWQTRGLQLEYFTGNNLSGRGTDGGTSPWRVAAPGTFAETILRYGCGD